MRDVIGKFGSSSPFDYLLWNGKTLIGIECKMLRARKSGNPKSFPFSMLSDDQEEGLLKLSRVNNSKSYVLVNFRWTNNKKGETYALTIAEYMYMRTHMDRKSIPLSKFRNGSGLQLERKGKGWNLEPLFKRGDN